MLLDGPHTVTAPGPPASPGSEAFRARRACPACGEGAARHLYECGFTRPPLRDYLGDYYGAIGFIELERLEGATYRLLRCRSCGLVYQQEIPGNALLERLYEHWIDPDLAADRERRRHDLECSSMHAQEITQLLAFLGRPPRETRVLDFGMGWGQWAAMARAFECETWGMELSRRRIEHAAELGIEVLEPGRLAKERFDLINAEQVFEHLPEPLETMRALAAALRPGGLLKLCVPNGRSIGRRLRRMDWRAPRDTRWSLHAVQPLEHLNCFDHRALTTMGRRAGLEPVLVPMRIQYACAGDWRGAGRILRNALYPVYRNLLRQGTWLVFRAGAGH